MLGAKEEESPPSSAPVISPIADLQLRVRRLSAESRNAALIREFNKNHKISPNFKDFPAKDKTIAATSSTFTEDFANNGQLENAAVFTDLTSNLAFTRSSIESLTSFIRDESPSELSQPAHLKEIEPFESNDTSVLSATAGEITHTTNTSSDSTVTAIADGLAIDVLPRESAQEPFESASGQIEVRGNDSDVNTMPTDVNKDSFINDPPTTVPSIKEEQLTDSPVIQVNKTICTLKSTDSFKLEPQRRGSRTFDSGNPSAQSQRNRESPFKPAVIRSIPLDIFKNEKSDVSGLFSDSGDERRKDFMLPSFTTNEQSNSMNHKMDTPDALINENTRAVTCPVPVASIPGGLFGGSSSNGDGNSFGIPSSSGASRKLPISAADIFNREPPSSVDTKKVTQLGLPPAPPGVVTNIQKNSPVAPKPKTQPSVMKAPVAVPAGMMRTPHGLVQIPSTNKNTNAFRENGNPIAGGNQFNSLHTAPTTLTIPHPPPAHNQNPINAALCVSLLTQPLLEPRSGPGAPPDLTTGKVRFRPRPPSAVISFGFGGKFSIFRPISSNSPNAVVKIYRVFDLITTSFTAPLSAIASFSMLKDFPGPLKKQDQTQIESLRTFTKEKTRTAGVESKSLLWTLLSIIVDHKGTVDSAELSDGRNVENEIANALLAAGTSRIEYGIAKPISVVSSSSDQYSSIECLLLQGQREAAVEVAMECNDFALAMLISGNCRVEVYQDIIKKFADSRFPPTSPLHFLSLLYSNQANESIKFGGKQLNSISYDNQGGKDLFLLNWKKNLAALLCNKTPVWKSLAEGIGNRLLLDASDVSAAHFAFICSGALPSAPGAGLFTLVGFNDSPQKLLQSIAMADPIAVESLRMTELLEFAITLSKRSDVAAISAPRVKQGFSFSGLFGGSNSAITSEGSKVSVTESLSLVSGSQIAAVYSALIPVKLKFAIMIADFGLMKEAAEYLISIRSAIAEIPVLIKQGDNKSPRPFSKSLLRSLDEFNERLSGIGEIKNLGAVKGIIPTPSAPVSTSGSFFGSVITAIGSSSALKGLVDGNDVRAPQLPLIQSIQDQSQQPSHNAQYFHPPSTWTPPQSINSGNVNLSVPLVGLPVPANILVASPALSKVDMPRSAVSNDGHIQDFQTVESKELDLGSDKSHLAAVETRKISAETNTKISSESTPGVISSMKKKLFSWLNPNVYDANENMSEGPAPVYDKDKGRWIIPGQEDEEPPALSAPPIFTSPPLVLVNSGITMASPDPVADLMRPPSYSALQATTMNTLKANVDPLADMMAPRNHSFSAFQPKHETLLSSTSRPAFSVWMPPPVPNNQSILDNSFNDEKNDVPANDILQHASLNSVPENISSSSQETAQSGEQFASAYEAPTFIVQQDVGYFSNSSIPSNFIEDF